MSNPNHLPIGVCTWSLQNDLAAITRVMQTTGLSQLQLAVAALDGSQDSAFRKAIEANGWTVTGTMVGFPQEDYSSLETIRRTGGIMPDDCWECNRDIVLKAIDLTSELEVPLLSFHAGFIDHGDKLAYNKFCARMRELADVAKSMGISLIMETGQETAVDLKRCLLDLNHPAIGVNFDPANMILYDKGDPIEAVRTLGPWIQHVHIKDAIRTKVPGEWGQEVPWGDGEVDHQAFLDALHEINYSGALAIEREAGESREADIILAAKRVQRDLA